MKARLAELAAQASEQVAQPAAWTPGGAFRAYPLRRAGLTAIVVHAARGKVDLGLARRRLLEVLGDGSDLTTFERATVLLHGLWLIEADARALAAASPPRVEVEGFGDAVLARRGGALVARLDARARAVRVPAFEGQAVLTARVVRPAATLRAEAHGLGVMRSYWLLGPEGRRRLAPGESVAQGAEVFVQLQIDSADEPRWRMLRSSYTVVEDFVPAGFAPVEDDKAHRGAPLELPLAHEALKRRVLGPERAVFYLEEPAPWSRRPRVLGYVVRAQFPGRFSAPPATVEDMYAPRLHGRSDPAVLSVASAGAR